LAQNAGGAYLFDADPSSATFGGLITQFLPAHTYPHHRKLGFCVSLDRRFAALGSPWEDAPKPGKWNTWKAGTAYVFDADMGSPNFSNPHAKFQNPIPWHYDFFGESLCIQNGVLAVGVPRDDTWNYDGGSVFVTRLVGIR
jgi:hypothetical protein